MKRGANADRFAVSVTPPSVRFRESGTGWASGLAAVTRIGLRTLREFFARQTVPLPGTLPSFDPGPCAASVWWAGQSTCLVGLGGRWFLTDPVLSAVIGRVSRRIVDAGFGPADLPPLDAVVVSHAHMDHMDIPTLLRLPGRPALYTAPGGSRYLGRVRRSERYDTVRGLAYGETADFDGARVTAVPAVHDGWRWGVDAALVPAHASGFVFESNEATVYYTGDTAYDDRLFKEVGRCFAIDVLICPIGPLEPRRMMKLFHADPADALRIFEDTGAKTMLPVHHNTFVQSWERPTDTVREFLELRAGHSRKKDAHVLRPGEQAVFRGDGEGVRLARVRSAYPTGFDDPRIPGDAAFGDRPVSGSPTSGSMR